MAQKQGRLVREPETSERRQEWGTIAENALRVDRADVEVIVDALSIDHAGSFNLFYLLRKHYWTAAGAEHKEVAAFLEDAYKRVREVTDDLAIRIVELGGGGFRQIRRRRFRNGPKSTSRPRISTTFVPPWSGISRGMRP